MLRGHQELPQLAMRVNISQSCYLLAILFVCPSKRSMCSAWLISATCSQTNSRPCNYLVHQVLGDCLDPYGPTSCNYVRILSCPYANAVTGVAGGWWGKLYLLARTLLSHPDPIQLRLWVRSEMATLMAVSLAHWRAMIQRGFWFNKQRSFWSSGILSGWLEPNCFRMRASRIGQTSHRCGVALKTQDHSFMEPTSDHEMP